jgi:hypothetical protein
LILQAATPHPAIMEYKKPAAIILAGAFVANALDARYGITLFTDLPPISAITVSASSGLAVSWTFYSTTTDERIEAPALDLDRFAKPL